MGIRWETVESISKVKAVVSGDSAADAEEAASSEPTLKWSDKPIVVFVCDEGGGCESFEKIEEIVLKDEKVALGMKAFRTVKMDPENANEDPILKEHGKTVPRMVFIEPTKMKVKVLEAKKVKSAGLYSLMKKTAKGFWKESLDKIVKRHLKLLVKQDKLANQIKTLQDRKGRLDEADEKKAKKIAEEIAEIEAERKELRTEKTELWKLTPKKKAA